MKKSDELPQPPKTIVCPFNFCGQPVKLKGSRTDGLVVEPHKLLTYDGSKPREACPASGMEYPLSASNRGVIKQEVEAMAKRLKADAAREKEERQKNVPSKVTCPFKFCGGYVEIKPYRPDMLLARHSLPPMGGGKNLSTLAEQTCPASWLPWPLTEQAKGVLEEQYRSMKERLEAQYEQARDDKLNPRPVSLDDAEGPAGNRHKTLGPKDDAWHLGGRKDEDISDLPPSVPKGGKVEFVTGGPSNGGQPMSGLEAAISTVNAAGLQEQEVIAASNALVDQTNASLHQLIATLESAIGQLQYVVDSQQSVRIGQAIANLSTAREELETGGAMLRAKVAEAIRQITVANEHQTEWIGVVSSA